MIEMTNNEPAVKALEPMQKAINDIDLNIEKEIPPSFYYYKRWLWMIFPWACLQTDQRFTFSKLINQCYSSNLRYLSVQEDKMLTNHAIKIVRETKAKRKAMIQKKTENLQSPPSPRRKEQLTNRINNSIIMQNKISLPKIHSTKTLNPVLPSVGYMDLSDANVSGMAMNRSALESVKSIKSLVENSQAKFNFFHNIKQDHEKIAQFMAQSQLLDAQKEDRVSKILEKSKFWEDRLKSYLISIPMKQRLLKAKEAKSLTNLRNQLNDHSQKEMKILSKKNSDLRTDLNHVSDGIRLQKREIERLQSTLDNMKVPGTQEYDSILQNKQELVNKAFALKEKVKINKRLKDRIERINQICEINKLQNEEWIRNLTFYQSNLAKAIAMLEKDIEKIRNEEIQLAEKTQQLIEAYNVKKDDHTNLLKDMQDELDRKKYLSQFIVGTDKIVLSSVDVKKKEIQYQLKDHIEKNTKHKNLLTQQKQLKRVKDEFDEYIDLENRMSLLFDPPGEEELQNLPSHLSVEECKDWFNKPSMRKCIEEMERSKDLKKILMNTKETVNKLQDRNQDSAKILFTLKEANKSCSKDVMNDKEYIRMNNNLIVKKIAQEEDQIKRCREFLDNSVLITDKTRLIMINIAKKLGISSSKFGELKYLSKNDIVIDVGDFSFSCHNFQIITKIREHIEKLKSTLTADEFKSMFSSNKLLVKQLLRKYVPSAEWTDNSFDAATQEGEDDMDLSTQVAN